MTNEEARHPGAGAAGQVTTGEEVRPSVAPAWERTAGHDGRPPRDRPAGRVSTIASQLPWIRHASPDRRREWSQILQEGRQRVHERKARVKAHPDLADRLCRSLGYQRFDQWTGYLAEGGPVRAETIAILRDVADREAAA